MVSTPVMHCQICGGVCHRDVCNGTYTYYRCADCHTSQLLPLPAEEELEAFYSRFHRPADEGGMYDVAELRMQADFSERIRMVRQFLFSPDARVLDVGCGKGFFVEALQRAGFKAEGIDLSPTGVEYAVQKLGVKARAGRLEDLPVQERFNTVTLWATIEHLSSPLEMLRAICARLEPGGTLVLDTGLGNCFFERFLAGHSEWYDAPQHLFVFSLEGIKRLCQDAGLDIIYSDTNHERSQIRKVIRWLMHSYLCVVPTLFIRPILGARRFENLKRCAKWPIGRAMLIVARKQASKS